jgi:hypothetical protein
MPAWFEAAVRSATAPLVKQLETLKAEKDTATTEAASSKAAKLTVEQQVEQLKARANADRVKAEIGDISRSVQFASADHGADAIDLFRARYKVETKDDGTVLATGRDGAAKPLSAAFADFMAKDGARYKAATAQPGAGAPAGAKPGEADGTLTREQIRERISKGEGFRGKLTADPNSPEVVIRKPVNPYAEQWNNRIAVHLRGQGQGHK